MLRLCRETRGSRASGCAEWRSGCVDLHLYFSYRESVTGTHKRPAGERAPGARSRPQPTDAPAGAPSSSAALCPLTRAAP
ncbi:hypothetical protein GCM10027570_43290 [Streptomonospora sediminis]